MPRRRLFNVLLATLIGSVVLSVSASSWYAARAIERTVLEEQYADLESAAHLALLKLADLIPGDRDALHRICREMGQQSLLQISVIFTSGEVACDSEFERTRIASPEILPEYRDAFAGRIGHAVRQSRAIGRSYLYVAVPLDRAGAIVGAVRVGAPFTSVAERIRLVRLQLLGAAAAIALFVSAAGAVLARRMTRPLEELRRGVERFAGGDLRATLPIPQTIEFASLARGLNTMAQLLAVRLAAIEEQRGVQEAILAGMVEGVLAVDGAGRVLLVNRAGAALLRRAPAAAIGIPLGGTPEETALAGFVARALAAPGPIEDELFSGGEGGLHLRVHGAPLRDQAGERIGALVVLHDVSRLSRLERSHGDFVTNLSHELKTPLTTITGYVELLLDAPLEDPETAARFLETIRRQAERLRLIVEDLVVLARLDQEGGGEGIAHEPANLADILADAVQAVRGSAKQADLRVELECPETLTVGASPLLLSQAVVNLLHNAISHSRGGERILVQASVEAGQAAIAVRDWGTGIPKEHLSRIFERFYRVDSGRSRRRGGSGLGLTIVQRIALVHGGTVTVESAPDEGSTFTIRISALS